MKAKLFLTAALGACALAGASRAGELPADAARCVELVDAKRNDEAGPYCERFRQTGGAHGRLVLGQYLLKKGDYNWAVTWLDPLKDDEGPERRDAILGLARAYAGKGMGNQALIYAEWLSRLFPGDLEALTFGAMEAAEIDRLSDAEDFADKAIAAYPKAAVGWLLKARVLSRVGLSEHAIDPLNRAVELEPRSLEARTERMKLFAAFGHAEEALADSAVRLELAPRDAEVVAMHARLLQALERNDEAATYADRALAIDPKNPRALSVRIYVRLTRNDADGAMADLAVLEKLVPNEDFHEAREWIAEIRRGK